jgi:hypothetical protein
MDRFINHQRELKIYIYVGPMNYLPQSQREGVHSLVRKPS